MGFVGHVEKSPEWRILVDEFMRLDYGDVIRHDALCALTGLVWGTQKYYQQTSMAMRVLLRDHERVVVCVPKVGYKRLEPERHGQETRRYLRLGTKRIKKGGKVARVTPFERLTPEQGKELEHSMVLLRALNVQMQSLYRSMRNVLPPVSERKAG